MALGEYLAPHIPYLRRYARALTGSQEQGDAWVGAALTAILAGTSALDPELPPRVALYQLFHAVWSGALVPTAEGLDHAAPHQTRDFNGVGRAALLLTVMEGFSPKEAGQILQKPTEIVERSAAEAERAIENEFVLRVLVIEDEPLIALDLQKIVHGMGHEVIGIADSKADAVTTAKAGHLNLILADINLGKGGSGLEAVEEILRSVSVPVIFITAYPELLLTGERLEPTYLVTKPFLPETVRAIIAQAVFRMRETTREAAE